MYEINGLWSETARQILIRFSPITAGERLLPNVSHIAKHRVSKKFTLNANLIELIKLLGSRHIHETLISDSILLIGCIEYENVTVKNLSIQAYINHNSRIENTSLTDKLTYCRLDYHPSKPGSIFTEPALHIHVGQNGAPRLPLSLGNLEDPLLWFLEFLESNFNQAAWIDWLEATAEKLGLLHHFTNLKIGYEKGYIYNNSEQYTEALNTITKAINSEKIRHASEYLRKNNNLLANTHYSIG